MRENVVLLLGRIREAVQLIARSISVLEPAVELSCPTETEIRQVQFWSMALCKVANEGLESDSLDLSHVERAALVRLQEATMIMRSVVASRGILSECDPNFVREVDLIDRVLWVEMPEAIRRLEGSSKLPESDRFAWAIDQIVSRKSTKPRRRPDANRDGQFVEWRNAGLDDKQIMSKWNNANPNAAVGLPTIRKAIERAKPKT